MNVEQESWLNAAIAANNISQLKLKLGDVAEALRVAERSITYADRSGDADARPHARICYAHVLHAAGFSTEAETRFREAEKMQGQDHPEYPLLGSVQGYEYCDLLLAVPERAAWRRVAANTGFQVAAAYCNGPIASAMPDARGSQIESCSAVSRRAEQTLQWGIAQSVPLDIAVNHLTLGRAALYKAILEVSSLDPSRSSLEKAVDSFRYAGTQDLLPNGLLTRAWLQSLEGNQRSAQQDLEEAWEIAERGPMPLFLADIHLHRARLFGSPHLRANGEKYPWESPIADLAEARRLIEKHGYLRRMEELEDAEVAMRKLPAN